MGAWGAWEGGNGLEEDPQHTDTALLGCRMQCSDASLPDSIGIDFGSDQSSYARDVAGGEPCAGLPHTTRQRLTCSHQWRVFVFVLNVQREASGGHTASQLRLIPGCEGLQEEQSRGGRRQEEGSEEEEAAWLKSAWSGGLDTVWLRARGGARVSLPEACHRIGHP